MLGRRGFLQALGFAPVAGPALARKAIETATAELAGVTTSGMVGGPAAPDQPYPGAIGAPCRAFDIRKALLRVLQTPELRGQYESLMFERRRHVGVLDLDLASKRSFSLAAKVTFQRQRNVAREIEAEAEDSPWSRAQEFLRKAAGGPFAR